MLFTSNQYTMLLMDTTKEHFNSTEVLKEEIVPETKLFPSLVSESPHRLMKQIALRCSIAVYQNILIGCYLFEN